MTTTQEQLTITKYDLYYEARMTKMETIAEEMKEGMKEMRNEIRALRSDFKTDFRWLFGVLIIVCGIMAHGFKWF
jgi:hypothetical protein